MCDSLVSGSWNRNEFHDMQRLRASSTKEEICAKDESICEDDLGRSRDNQCHFFLHNFSFISFYTQAVPKKCCWSATRNKIQYIHIK